jgi:hypothetical protein
MSKPIFALVSLVLCSTLIVVAQAQPPQGDLTPRQQLTLAAKQQRQEFYKKLNLNADQTKKFEAIDAKYERMIGDEMRKATKAAGAGANQGAMMKISADVKARVAAMKEKESLPLLTPAQAKIYKELTAEKPKGSWGGKR